MDSGVLTAAYPVTVLASDAVLYSLLIVVVDDGDTVVECDESDNEIEVDLTYLCW